MSFLAGISISDSHTFFSGTDSSSSNTNHIKSLVPLYIATILMKGVS